MALDDIDRRILAALAADARMTNSELAERVGLSASPCWQRVKRLERDGYIAGYGAVLNQKLLGRGETVIIEIILDHHDAEILNRFSEAIARMPEVREAYLMTGEYDFIVKVAISGTEAYETFLREKLYKIPGIRQTRSLFALRCVKDAFPAPA